MRGLDRLQLVARLGALFGGDENDAPAAAGHFGALVLDVGRERHATSAIGSDEERLVEAPPEARAAARVVAGLERDEQRVCLFRQRSVCLEVPDIFALFVMTLFPAIVVDDAVSAERHEVASGVERAVDRMLVLQLVDINAGEPAAVLRLGLFSLPSRQVER